MYKPMVEQLRAALSRPKGGGGVEPGARVYVSCTRVPVYTLVLVSGMAHFPCFDRG